MAADGKRSKGSRLFSYLGKRKTRESTPTPHLMEELNAPRRDVPLWSRAFAPLGFVLVMVAMGVGCFYLGSPAVGVLFCLFGILPAVAVVVLVARALPGVFGPQRRAGEEELGPYLGGGGDKRVREMSPGLSAHEGELIEWDRAEEAQCTWRWLHEGERVFERVETVSDDGVTLVAHALECCPGSSRWLVFSHGYTDNWRCGLTYARRYAEAGFNLLFCDLRAHGESGGDWVGAGWLDRRDLVAWSRWVVGRAGSDVRVVLAGISMGAASSIMACGEKDLPEQVRVCIADSAYTDFWRTAVNVVATGSLGTPSAPPHPLVDLARLTLRLAPGGYDLAFARPVDALAHSRVPVLLVQGDADRVVPPYMASELASAGTGHELVSFPNAGHCCAVLPSASPLGEKKRQRHQSNKERPVRDCESQQVAACRAHALGDDLLV